MTLAANSDGTESRDQPVWKDQVFWFVVSIGVGYGMVYNFLPATFPVFRREFAASLAQLGRVQFLFFLSGLGFSVVGGSAIAWLRLKHSALAAFAIAGGALLVIAGSHGMAAILISAAFFGFAISAMIVIGSSIVSGHFRNRRQSVFFLTGLSDASGSMIGPAILGWWLANSVRWNMSWRAAYFASAALMGLLLIWGLMVPAKAMDGGAAETTAAKAVFSHTREILGSAALYIAVALGFCHGLAQAGMLSFVGQLAIDKLHIDAARAAYFISCNAAGILSGRLMFSWITARWKIPELVVICFCAAAETAAFLGAIASPSYLGSLAMFTVAGIFVSTIGPSLNSYVGGKFSDRAATAFSLFAGLSNVGAAIGPFLIGTIGSDMGVGKGILFAPAFSGLLSALALLWFLKERVKDRYAKLITLT